MKIGSNDTTRAGWPADISPVAAEGPCEAGEAMLAFEGGEVMIPSPVERGEGSLAGAHFGQGLWASSNGEGVRASEASRASSAQALLEGLQRTEGQAGAPSLSAFLIERGLSGVDRRMVPRPGLEGGLPSQAPWGDMARPKAGRGAEGAGVSASQERVHEWGREFERDMGARGREKARSGPYEAQRRAADMPEGQARAAPFLELTLAGHRGELRAPRKGDEAVDEAPRERARHSAAESEDAFVIYDMRCGHENRLRFDVDVSFRGARALCRLEFEDATYRRVALDEASSAFLGRVAEGGHPSATGQVVALLRAFVAGEAMAFPVAFEPAAAPRGVRG